MSGTATTGQTRAGVTLSSSQPLSSTLTQSGNYLVGQLAQTQTGADRYSLLENFRNTSNSYTGSAGVVDYSPVGAPLFMGLQPSAPTGGGPVALPANHFAALFAHAGQANGSMANAQVRGPEAAGMLGYTPGRDLSGATVTLSHAEQGTDMIHRYCFPAGTRVLLADGTTRPIERIEPGDWVLAVRDDDPLAVPMAAAVERVFHNAPARLLSLHLGVEVIRTSYGHPFYTRDRGWVFAADLRPGDELRTPEGGWVAVTELFDNGEVEAVYNFEVAGCRTYYVVLPESGTAVLVHNLSPLVAAGYRDPDRSRHRFRRRRHVGRQRLGLEQGVGRRGWRGHGRPGGRPGADRARCRRRRGHGPDRARASASPWAA